MSLPDHVLQRLLDIPELAEIIKKRYLLDPDSYLKVDQFGRYILAQSRQVPYYISKHHVERLVRPFFSQLTKFEKLMLKIRG